MNARRAAVLVVLAAALAVAGAAMVSTQLRLATNPPSPPAPTGSPSPAAYVVFDREQTADEQADAGYVPGLDNQDALTVRRLGRPEGVVVIVWRTSDDEVCEGGYRPGPSPLLAEECATSAAFAEGGVSLRWPDSPDLGPFDIEWRPDGQLLVRSARPPGDASSSPAPTPSG